MYYSELFFRYIQNIKIHLAKLLLTTILTKQKTFIFKHYWSVVFTMTEVSSSERLANILHLLLFLKHELFCDIYQQPNKISGAGFCDRAQKQCRPLPAIAEEGE